jgi:hypothetical protein
MKTEMKTEIKSKAKDKLRDLWERIRARLTRYRKRLADIPRIKPEAFETLVFFELVFAGSFFCTGWFWGPVIDFWRTLLPRASWDALLISVAAVVLVGFFEADYRARRTGSLLAYLLFACTGAWTVLHFPHYPFGFMFLGLAGIPIWLHSEFKAMRIREASLVAVPDVAPELLSVKVERAAEEAIVRMPRRV